MKQVVSALSPEMPPSFLRAPLALSSQSVFLPLKSCFFAADCSWDNEYSQDRDGLQLFTPELSIGSGPEFLKHLLCDRGWTGHTYSSLHFTVRMTQE